MTETKSVGVEGAPERRREEHADADLLGFDPDDALKAVAAFARENPHAALAGAAAIGFLLGGGLTPRLLGTFATLATRKYLNEALREAVESALHR